jgi:hypothetical protein
MAFFEVPTGAKRFRPCTGQDDATRAIDVTGEAFEDLDEIAPHLRVYGIGNLRPIQGDQNDMPVALFNLDGLETLLHARSSVPRLCETAPLNYLARPLPAGTDANRPVADLSRKRFIARAAAQAEFSHECISDPQSGDIGERPLLKDLVTGWSKKGCHFDAVECLRAWRQLDAVQAFLGWTSQLCSEYQVWQ